MPARLTIVLIVLLVPALASGDPLTEGKLALALGRYSEARALLQEAMAGPTRAEATIALCELELLHGALDRAMTLARQAGEMFGVEAKAALLGARVQRRRGRYDDAVAALRRAMDLDPELGEARVELGELLTYLGRRAEARDLLEPVVAADVHGDHVTAGDLVVLGRAAAALGEVKVAFDALDQATVRDGRSVEARLWLGRVALSRGDLTHALQGANEALAIAPKDPRALVLKARGVFEGQRDFDEVEGLLARAQEVDPRQPEALRLRAEVALADLDSRRARRLLQDLLRDNPRDLDALALTAAAHCLEDDLSAVAKLRAEAFRVNPRFAGFYQTLARTSERAYRYSEAVAWARKALNVDPDYWPALKTLGIDLTRTGHEERGRRALEQYVQHDDYDAAVVNTLNLFERDLVDYREISRGPFVLRAHKDEIVLLDLFAGPLLQEFWARYRKSYRFTPKGPISVEIFHRPELFGVRSVGLPGIMSHGVSFGRVITARSPNTGDFNWAQVLAHELSHVFGLQLSRHRVPRWLTEGLAEYETNRARREWSRHQDRALALALERGRLIPLSHLDRGFTRPRHFGDVLAAYQEASYGVHFLCDTWGYDRVIRMHRVLAGKAGVARAIRKVLGVEPGDLDTRFVAWLQPKLARFSGRFLFDRARFMDQPRWEAEVKARPEDPAALAGLAASSMVAGGGRGDPSRAMELAARALSKDPGHPLARFVAGLAAWRLGRAGEAARHMEALGQRGVSGPEIDLLSAMAYLELGDLDAARSKAEEAMAQDPDDPEPVRLLGKIAGATGDRAREIEILARLSVMDQNDPAPPMEVARFHLAHRDPAQAMKYGRMALSVALFSREIHEVLATAAIQAGDRDAALLHGVALGYLSAQGQAEHDGWVLPDPAARAARLAGPKVVTRFVRRITRRWPKDPAVARVARAMVRASRAERGAGG